MTIARPHLLESDAGRDPFALFGRWYEDARTTMPQAEAMVLATAGGSQPSARMVLLKEWDERGFVFHTNHDSRKGREIAVNPRVALLFHWEPVARQVRVEGTAEHLPDRASDAYFRTRPFGGQVGAHASHQSRTIEDREALDHRFLELELELAGHAVPRPPWWGGYRVVPHVFEFWQGRENRLHDRLRFTPQVGTWQVERLQP